MVVQEDNNTNNKFSEKYENTIIPELEIVIMPYKYQNKVRMEIMNNDFAKFAKEQGVITDDMIDGISWKTAGDIFSKLISIAPKFYSCMDM